MARRNEEEKKLSFSQIQQQLNCGEDFVLANRLQEMEYATHYNHNRTVNGTIVSDRKKTKEEQRAEDEQAASVRRWGEQQRCLTDEEFARRLQEEFDRVQASEHFARTEQLLEDERIAKTMQGQTNYGAEHLTNNTDLLIPIPITQYDNMANSFIETSSINSQPVQFPPPPTGLTYHPPVVLSSTNPFLQDVQAYLTK